jgi:hypothetical protein
VGYEASGPDITPALLDSFHNRQFAGDIVGDGLCSEKTAGTAGSSSQNGELILGFSAKPDGQGGAIGQLSFTCAVMYTKPYRVFRWKEMNFFLRSKCLGPPPRQYSDGQ